MIDLRAILRMEDRGFTRGAQRAENATRRMQREIERANRQANLFRDSQGRLRDSMGRYASQADVASRSNSSFTRSLGSAGKGFGSAIKGFGLLAGAIGGVTAAYLGVEGAKKIFDATVLNAARREQSNVIIGAMFDDKKLTKQYTNMLDRFSSDSPVMNSQDMYGNSKSFITVSKNVKQLEKMWSLTERMAAIDPVQGVEGSVFALRELFSGDAVSMVERFEMPRKIMNEIKKLPLDQQLTRLDKYFNSIGMTTKLIDEMGGSALGLWAQVQEKFQLVLAGMGEPSLKIVKNFLVNILDKLQNGELNRFANVGARWIQSILTGLTNESMRVYDWFDALTASEEFKSKTSLSAQVKFVIEDLFNRFSGWMNTTGRDQLEKAMKFVIDVGASALSDAQGPLVEAAANIGIAIGKAMASNASKELLTASLWNLPGMPTIKYGMKLWDGFTGIFKSSSKSSGKKSSGSKSSSKSNTSVAPAPRRAASSGLKYVPYDSYPMSLHKGERVLTSEEARRYKGGGGGRGTVVINGGIHLHDVAGNMEKSADKFLEIITRKVMAAGEGGA
ncbi:hypothetical protein [Bacillus massiliglaciei]|uniref:hypothetical protein n=1 Tax=Bacillus massiliglaciei TaxID=1816693 RepID=UPI000A826BCE|nr:hypothetical protein [Bacillus massiliglaciei]